MYVFGFTVTASSTGKFYGYLGTSTGHIYYAHGPAATPMQNLRSEDQQANIEAVIERVRDKYVAKVSQGEYDLTAAGFAEVDPGDFATKTDVRAALTALHEHTTGVLDFRHTSNMSSMLGQIRRICSDPDDQPVAPQAAEPARVEDRDTALRHDTDTFTRPNGEVYRPRLIGPHTDVLLLRAFRQMPRPVNVLLAGPAGSGKTAVAEVAHEDLITIGAHGDMTVPQIVGQLMPTAAGGWEFVEGPLTTAMREGRPLLIDEINKLPHEVVAVLHSAGDGRGYVRLDDRPNDPIVYATEGFCMLGTLNPDEMGGAGLPEPITSRFSVQVDVETDYDAARALGCPPELVTVAENLRSRNRTDTTGQFAVWVPQMRELLAAGALVSAGLGLTFAAQAMLSQCPNPEDVPVVADAMQNVLGQSITPLAMGAQA